MFGVCVSVHMSPCCSRQWRETCLQTIAFLHRHNFFCSRIHVQIWSRCLRVSRAARARHEGADFFIRIILILASLSPTCATPSPRPGPSPSASTAFFGCMQCGGTSWMGPEVYASMRIPAPWTVPCPCNCLLRAGSASGSGGLQ